MRRDGLLPPYSEDEIPLSQKHLPKSGKQQRAMKKLPGKKAAPKKVLKRPAGK